LSGEKEESTQSDVKGLSRNAFPLPPLKDDDKKTKAKLELASYHQLWNALQESEMHEELFRRYLFKGVKMLGGSAA
jgi:hypothetical protein